MVVMLPQLSLLLSISGGCEYFGWMKVEEKPCFLQFVLRFNYNIQVKISCPFCEPMMLPQIQPPTTCA